MGNLCRGPGPHAGGAAPHVAGPEGVKIAVYSAAQMNMVSRQEGIFIALPSHSTLWLQ
jgi:hypothetical protein